MSDWVIGGIVWLFIGLSTLFGPIFSARLREGFVRSGEEALRRAVEHQRKKHGDPAGYQVGQFMRRVFSRETHLRMAYFLLILHGPFSFVTLFRIWWKTRTPTPGRAEQ